MFAARIAPTISAPAPEPVAEEPARPEPEVREPEMREADVEASELAVAAPPPAGTARARVPWTEQAAPRPSSAPSVPPPAPAPPAVLTAGPATHVHATRLSAASGPVALTPSQAVRLAADGPAALRHPRPRAN